MSKIQYESPGSHRSVNMHKRRVGTNAGKGHVFEIEICMLLMQRCAKYNQEFKLTSNVKGADEIFDDVVIKVYRQDDVQNLFMQAKNKIGKSASIFEKTVKGVKKGGNLPDYPTEDISRWFDSYQIRQAQCGEENFELVYFAIIDIENQWKKFFEECSDSLFEDLLSTRKESTRTPVHLPKVYKLKVGACQEMLRNTVNECSEQIEDFCARLRIYALQPDHTQLKDILKHEMHESDINTEWIYNYVYQHVHDWTLLTETVADLNRNIFQYAKNIKDISRFEVTLNNSGEEFSFQPEVLTQLSSIMEFGGNVITLVIPPETSLIYVDLIKEQINTSANTFQTVFLFTVSDLTLNIDKVIEFSNNKERETYCVVQITDSGNTRSKKLKVSMYNLMQRAQESYKLKLVFLLERSLVIGVKCSKKFPSQHYELALSFSSLSQETQRLVLSKEIEIMGRDFILYSITRNNENAINQEILADVRNKRKIVFGVKMFDKSFNSATYISRKLELSSIVSVYANFIRTSNVEEKNEKHASIKSVPQDYSYIEHQDVLRKSGHCPMKVTDSGKSYYSQGVPLLVVEENTPPWFKPRNPNTIHDDMDSLIDKHSPNLITEEGVIRLFIDNPDCSKVLLVSSKAGMGKTTLAASIAEQVCTGDFAYWPVFVTLNKHHMFYEALQDKNVQISPFDLLYECVGPEQVISLEKYMRLQGRVLVLLDGFDEIAPLYTELILTIIESMCETAIYKILILTRPHLAETITRRTRALSLSLTTFTPENVKEFFRKYYGSKLHCSEPEKIDRLENFCHSLKNFVFSKMRSYWTDMTGVPLQTKMVVDVFMERCNKYLETESEEILPSKRDTGKDYHELFVNQKIDIYVKQKLNLNKSMLYNHGKDLITNLHKSHTYCALKLIFGETDAIHYFKFDSNPESEAEKNMKCGIVTACSNTYIEFIHRSFAEYYCALEIARIMQSTSSITLTIFIFCNVLILDKYHVIRKFLNLMFAKSKEMLNIPNGRDRKLLVKDGKEYSNARGLYRALQEKNFNIATKLLVWCTNNQHGALDCLIHYTDKDIKTPLHLAAKNGLLEISKYLLGAGAKLTVRDKDESTPLHLAAREGHYDIARLLLNNKSDYEAQDKDGRTPLHLAAYFGHTSVVRLLSQSGCDTNVRDKDGQSPLYRAAMYNELETARVLVEMGAKVNQRDYNGKTVLDWAAFEGKAESVRVLVQLGAGVNKRDKDGNTPLHWAAQIREAMTVRVLVELGAKVNKRDKSGNTPLHAAAITGMVDTVRVLVELGAGVNERNNLGYTPLHWAAQYNKKHTARVLLENGAAINSTNLQHQTPLTIARNGGNIEVTKFLESLGATE